MRFFARRRRDSVEESSGHASSGDVRVIPLDRGGVDGDDVASDDAADPSREGTPTGARASFLDELSEAFDEDAGDGTADEVTVQAAGRGDAAQSEQAGTADDHGWGDQDSGERATISIGADDELPDAMYLDEELGDDTSGTVFIDDDDRGDAVVAHEAAPGIEPRLRQRRIGVRRAEARGRLKWVAVGLVAVLVVVGLLAVLGSGLFAVDRVDVAGRRYADDAAVQQVVDDLRGTPVLLVDADDAERRLEEIPWVADARVTTDFPDRATIELRERVPLAAVPGPDGRFRVLDREGRVLTILDGQPIAPVLITSPLTTDLAPGEFAEVGYAAAAALVTKLTPDVRARLVSVEVTSDGSDMVLRLRESGAPPGLPGDADAPIEVRLGAAVGDNDQFEKLVRLERVLDDLEASDATVVDVSTEETTLR